MTPTRTCSYAHCQQGAHGGPGTIVQADALYCCGKCWTRANDPNAPVDEDDDPHEAAPTEDGGEDHLCDVCEEPFQLTISTRRKTRYYLCSVTCGATWLKEHKPRVVECQACHFVFFLSEQTPDTDLCAECRNPDTHIVRPCAYTPCGQPFPQPRGPKRYRRKYCCDDHDRLAQAARVKGARAAARRPRPVPACAECGQPQAITAGGRGPLPKFCGDSCRQRASRRRRSVTSI